MKCSLIVLTVMLYCSLFNESFAQVKDEHHGHDHGPKATYSADFKIGSADHSKMILELWKDWDDNDFSRHDYFADTITMYLPGGDVVKGKAAAIEGAKKYRGGMTKAVSTVHAWVPLHSNDTGDDVVCIWGTEEDTYPDGKVVKKDLHEVWWINKAGKISTMRQWKAAFGK